MKTLQIRFLFRVIISIGLFLFSACTTVKISGDVGNTIIVREFGIVYLQVCPQTDLVAAEIKCLGAVSGVLGFSLGVTQQTVVLSSASCKAVFWIENEEQAERIKMLLKGIDGICSFSMDGKED